MAAVPADPAQRPPAGDAPRLSPPLRLRAQGTLTLGAAGLVFTALSLLLAWLLWQGRGGDGAPAEPRSRLRLRSAIPPLLILACIPSGCVNERFDALRLFANGMSVTEVQMQGGRRQALAVPGCDAYFGARDMPLFVVGRARGCVDLIVQDPGGAPIDGALVRLDPGAGADATLRLTTRTADGGALIAAQDGPEGRTYAGALPVEEGDAVCISACATPAARWWLLQDDALVPAGGGAARPLRVRGGLYGTFRPYGPTDRIQRLSALLCEQPDADGACDSPALADPAARGAARQPALSFLFQQGGTGGSAWRAMLLDPGALLRKADGQLVRPALTLAAPLRENESRHVALLAIRGNALRELRSFTLAHDLVTDPVPERRFRLVLDTPEMVPIGHCAEPLSRLAVTPEQLSPEAFAIPAFGNRPGSVLASAAAGLPIDRFDLCRSTSFAFHAPQDRPATDATAGPVRRQIAFQVDRMGVPWLLVLLAAGMALVVHAASENYWERHRLDGTLLALTQYLLAVRAIVGIEGVFNDPALDWRAIYADAGTALLVLPAILVAARPRAASGLTPLLSLGGFLLAGFAALWWWLGPPDLITAFLSVLALLALAARALAPLIGRAAGTAAARLGTLRGRGPGFWPILLAIIVGARILLGLLGFRERLFGVALSAVYVPLLLAVIAAILAQAEAAPAPRRRWLGLMFLGALAVGAGLVALIINDIGFALVHVPPIAGVALWRLVQWSKAQKAEGLPASRTARLLWAAPAAALVAGYLALWALVALTPPPGEDAPLEQRVAYAVSDRSTDPNWLRLRAVFAPGQIPEIGNRAAAIQLDQSQLLGDLTGSLFGHGWLTPVDLGTFRFQATHLSDYLSASHLMAPFGRAGALALLLVLAAAAGAAVSGRVRTPAEWPRLAGALAAWTLFGAAAYMVCANLLLVPFTGRNIYLLAASSGGDLMEGLILLLMARIGLAHRSAA